MVYSLGVSTLSIPAMILTELHSREPDLGRTVSLIMKFWYVACSLREKYLYTYICILMYDLFLLVERTTGNNQLGIILSKVQTTTFTIHTFVTIYDEVIPAIDQ